jgi:antitoxin HicB
MLYTIIYTQEPEWGYTVECIDLPGCVSYGETMEEAQVMINEAIQAYQESLVKHQEKSLYRPFFISTLRVHEAV